MIQYIKTQIQINDRAPGRCSRNCQHIEKKRGNYVCTLFGDAEVDTGEDDDKGYGFQRTKQCKDSVIGQPHLGGFAGDL